MWKCCLEKGGYLFSPQYVLSGFCVLAPYWLRFRWVDAHYIRCFYWHHRTNPAYKHLDELGNLLTISVLAQVIRKYENSWCNIHVLEQQRTFVFPEYNVVQCNLGLISQKKIFACNSNSRETAQLFIYWPSNHNFFYTCPTAQLLCHVQDFVVITL